MKGRGFVWYEAWSEFEWNGKKFLKDMKRVRKRLQGEERRVKNRDSNMLVEGSAISYR